MLDLGDDLIAFNVVTLSWDHARRQQPRNQSVAHPQWPAPARA